MVVMVVVVVVVQVVMQVATDSIWEILILTFKACLMYVASALTQQENESGDYFPKQH